MKRSKPLQRRVGLKPAKGLKSGRLLAPRCEGGHGKTRHNDGPPDMRYCVACKCNDYRPKRSLTQGQPLKPRKSDPAKRRFAKHRNPKFTRWVSTLVCLIGNAACWHPVRTVGDDIIVSDPAHIGKTRAQGADDVGEVVNLCRFHHIQQEGRTTEFAQRHHRDLKAHALHLWTRYERDVLGKPVL